MWQNGWGYGGGPPPINVYPPVYGPPPNYPQQCTKSEMKEYLAFARAWSNRDKSKKKEEKKEEIKKRIIIRNFTIIEIVLFLFLLGPIIGPLFNKVQQVILHALN